MIHPTRTLLAGAALALSASTPAWATNGYFSHGYGLKAKGMGGAATAMAEDAFGGANNPATMAWVGSRLDLGADAFMPKRDSARSGALITSLNGAVDSDKTLFLIPELGYNRMLGSDRAVGLTVYGNGGLNTDYPQGNFQCPTGPTTVAAANMLCGSGRLGVDLMQLILAPTFAIKLAPSHSVGASLLLGYQRFKAEGLQAFDGPGSSAPGSVTNRGYDSATGAGVRVGYLGRFGSMLSVGAAYSSKIDMSAFDKYKGLFAGAGDFDIPSNYSVGLSVTPASGLTFAFDVQRINYSDVAAVNNPSQVAAPLGAANGPGFGWRDIDVYKLGVQWQATPQLTLRAGYNKGDKPITSADVTFNILAPGVVTTHYTLGFTQALGIGSEITGTYMLAPRQTVSGPSLLDNFFGAGTAGQETIGMKQQSIGIAWALKF